MHVVQADAGKVTAKDLFRMHPLHNGGDFYGPSGFHTVLSDMCHSTIGNSAADVARSLSLARCAAALALRDMEEELSEGIHHDGNGK